MNAVERFYDKNDCNAKIHIRSVYLGDFSGPIRKDGFIEDVATESSSLIPKMSMDFSDLWYKRQDAETSVLVEELCKIYGEKHVSRLKLYDSTTGRKIYDIGIDKQYVNNAIGLLKIKGFIVKKRRKYGNDIWDVSLL